MTRQTLAMLASLASGLAFGHDQAAEPVDIELTPETVLIAQGEVTVTVADMATSALRIPTERRANYLADSDRIGSDLSNLITQKLLAHEARGQGLMDDEDASLQAEIALAVDQILARRAVNHHLEQAPEVDFEQLAYERYLSNESDFDLPERRDVTHILLAHDGDARSSAETEALIAELRGRVIDGEDIGELAVEYSDDPSAANNGGRFREMQRGQMVESFERAAFALENAGDVSDVVETRFGLHIIQLNAIEPARQQPFEEVKVDMIESMRAQRFQVMRDDYVRNLTTQHEAEINGDAIAVLREYLVERYADEQFSSFSAQ